MIKSQNFNVKRVHIDNGKKQAELDVLEFKKFWNKSMNLFLNILSTFIAGRNLSREIDR